MMEIPQPPLNRLRPTMARMTLRFQPLAKFIPAPMDYTLWQTGLMDVLAACFTLHVQVQPG